MRELLFRGQTRRPGEKVRIGSGKPLPGNWVYGGIFHQSDRSDSFSIIYTYDPVEKHTVYADTVGQYTGLTDKNGKKIFEGDILESRASEYKEDWKKWTVLFQDGSFCFERENLKKRKYKHEQNLLCEDEIELYGLVIIGNIHDNPELLTGGKTDV